MSEMELRERIRKQENEIQKLKNDVERLFEIHHNLQISLNETYRSLRQEIRESVRNVMRIWNIHKPAFYEEN